MKAEYVVRSLGEKLIGRTVWTPPMGEYPGGEAIVKNINPDPAAPEIVLTVSHQEVGDMGVFGNESIRLLDNGKKAAKGNR